jgi:diguanylate cyclase (GGDEF)-like protein
LRPNFYRPAPRLGIRSRLLLVTFAMGLLFVFYLAFSTVRQSGRDLQQVREQMRLLAGLAGSRLDDHLSNVTQLLTTLAGTLPMGASDIEQNNAMLRRLALEFPANVSGVSLWAPDGSSLGSSDAVPGASGSAAGRPFFINARRAPGLAIEAPLHLNKGDEWTAVFALRVIRDGGVVGVISVTTRLHTLTSLLDPDGALPDGAVISIIDADGVLLGRSLEPGRWIGTSTGFDRAALLRLVVQGQGSGENTGVDGVRRIAGYARSQTAPWMVYVGIPVETALAPANRYARESLLVGVAMLLVGLALAAWVADRIARPLRQLSDDARRFGEGRLEHRSTVRAGDEIGLLATTLNRMASALQERTAAVRRSEERLVLALEGSDQSLFDWDIVADRIHYSARGSSLRGGPGVPVEETSTAMQALIHPDDRPHVLSRLADALTGRTPLYEAEYRVRHADGSWPWLRSRGRVVERGADGRALRLVGTAEDITWRKAAEDRLRQRAEFDALTGLPNRALFNDRLASAVERARRSGLPMALLFLDIDHFKGVNDSRGHIAGDELLRIVADRLLAAVRSVDTVSRLAGDEFTVILESLAEPADAENVARKLVEALRPPMLLAGALVHVSTSVGLALLDPDDDDPQRLMRRADEALYAAKRAGRDRYAISPTALA